MAVRFIHLGVLAALTVFLAACAPVTPTISEAERQELAKNATPYANDVGYTQALSKLGKMIEAIPADKSPKIYLQAKPIVNQSIGSELTGSPDLPLNITNMVITALNGLSSVKRLLIIPYDPNYYLASRQTNVVVGASQLAPNLVLAGSITEFDKDVEATSNDMNLDLILDRGKPDTSLSGKANNSRTMSRVTLDLYLIDARLNAVIPGLSVSNTVNVMEIQKGREVAFAIFGSGFGVSGNITHAQGFQRAVRNLVGYSVVQLLGRFYDLPYEPLLGLTSKDPLIKRSETAAQQPADSASQPEAVSAPSQQPAVQRTTTQTPAAAEARTTPKSRPAKPASARPAQPENRDASMEDLL